MEQKTPTAHKMSRKIKSYEKIETHEDQTLPKAFTRKRVLR